MIELLDGQVQYLVTECSLPQILYCNEKHPDNICDIQKTRTQILAGYKQHNNGNVMAERGDKKYVHTGRFQDEEQARAVDCGLRGMLRREGLAFTPLKPELEAINALTATLLA